MGKYLIKYTDTALKHLRKQKKYGNKATLKKIDKLIAELKEHPYTGTGKPEELKNDLQGFWSRRINQKDRLIYDVNEKVVLVRVISALGHYGNK